MIHTEYWLPNDNVVIWIGRRDTIGSSDPSENALILMGGDVLLLNTRQKISLIDKNIRADLLALARQEFETKYSVELDFDLWTHLKEKIQNSTYPPFQNKQRFNEYVKMISQYLSNINASQDESRLEQYYMGLIRASIRKLKEINKLDTERIISMLR